MEDNWISADKPPNIGELVIVCVNGEVAVDTYEYRNGKWWPYHYPGSDDRVTHWQPLPKPPKQIKQ